MQDINAWWKPLSGECFWLGLTGHDGSASVLAVPCREGRTPVRTGLIHHVDRDEIVFHYDEDRQAIVAWSTTRARARRQRLLWNRPEGAPDPTDPEAVPRAAWSVPLGDPVPLDRIVGVATIAAVQWDLFPALRSLEDRVGEPLYYPFTMGSPTETALEAGHLFKLPSLFVRSFPALSAAAAQAGWVGPLEPGVLDRSERGIARAYPN